jgi:hypothetical protein
MILDPAQYADFPTYELLKAAAQGVVPLDHRFLHAMVDEPVRSVADLVRFGLEQGPDDPLDLQEDILAILRYLKAPEGVPFFVECIRREPQEVTDELVEALVAQGQAAVGPLLELHAELEEEQAGDVAFVLASLRVRDERILVLLLEYFEYNAQDGAFCLGLYGDPGARGALERVLAETDPKSKDDAPLRLEINEALERLTEQPPESEPMPTPDLWSLYPEQDEPRFDLMPTSDRLAFLDSPLAAYRRAAAAVMGLDEQTPTIRRRLLEVARGDTEVEVRAAAWQALGESASDEEVKQALTGKLNDEAAPALERVSALLGLVEDDDEAIRRRIPEFYEIAEARVLAMRAMWRTFDRQYADYFPRHLNDERLEVRREAIRGIGYLRITSASGLLKPFFADEDLRLDALHAYAMTVPFDLSPGRAMRLLRKVEEAGDGLSPAESEFIEFAIDERLAMNGMREFFSQLADEHEHDHHEQVHGLECNDEHGGVVSQQEPAQAAKVGRNDPCPCGSGKKYKKCCGQ